MFKAVAAPSSRKSFRAVDDVKSSFGYSAGKGPAFFCFRRRSQIPSGMSSRPKANTAGRIMKSRSPM